MKVLIVGSGGREHAIAWKLSQSPQSPEIFVHPGNAGTAQIATNVELPDHAPADLIRFIRDRGIDLVVIGPEAPLVAGLADQLRARGILVVGPSAQAAELEGSKVFAKEFFSRHEIPTATFLTARSPEEAIDALHSFRVPVVIKADGLAAGKGVVIAHSIGEAETAIEDLMRRRTLGIAGHQIVLEEFLIGEEVSFIVLTDGERVMPFPPAQDHKAIYDGDRGPNTGGMGAYCDSRILVPELREEILDRIVFPTLQGLREEGRPFHGFLFAGLILTKDGPKVLEFNVRLGDPETQALLCPMEGDFLRLLHTCASGVMDTSAVRWRPEPAVCVVLAAGNYPGTPITGDRIDGVATAEAQGAVVFHAGTRMQNGHLVTAGGRVLGVTASAPTLPAAIATVYRAADEISFPAMQRRSDIGQKGLQRW